MSLKKLLLGSVAGLLFATSALAQCPGINCTLSQNGLAFIAKSKTYHAISVSLVPASAATDIFCLNGSTTKTVHLDQVWVSGFSGTAITVPVIIKLNHSLDTGGTAATGLALPVPASAISTDPASTATLTAYTANPTIGDSTPSYLGAQAISLAVTTGAGVPVQFLPSTAADMFNKGWDIAPAATVVQQLCIYLNAATISSGSLTIWVEWTETP